MQLPMRSRIRHAVCDWLSEDIEAAFDPVSEPVAFATLLRVGQLDVESSGA
jgi:hypothetical protein